MHLEINIKNGCIHLNKFNEYKLIAENIANDVCVKLGFECSNTEWHTIFRSVIEKIAENNVSLKKHILTQLKYPLYLHEENTERIQLPYNEAKAYVDGYNNATAKFNNLFNKLEDVLKERLDYVMPTDE